MYPCSIPGSIQKLVEKLEGTERSSLELWVRITKVLPLNCEVSKRAAHLFIQEHKEELESIKEALELIDFTEVKNVRSDTPIHGEAPGESSRREEDSYR